MSCSAPSPTAGDVGAVLRPHAARGDCEQVRPGFFGQRINTVTSLAYIVGGAYVLSRGSSRRRLWSALLVALGVGSVGYHGPGTRSGKLAHDASVVAAVGVLGTAAVRPNRNAVAAAGLGGVAVSVHATTRTGCRACTPESVWQGHGLWHLLSAVALTAVAVGERPRP